MRSMNEFSDIPKISIGLPVYNGEKFLRQRLDSILSQTFQDFELIISDNVSTDLTSEICKEYAKKDSRIYHIRQKKNMSVIWNFNFVLQEANSDYFVWAAVDDLWETTFLEKNIKTLDEDENIVCSVSKTKFYSVESEDINAGKINHLFRTFLEKFKSSVRQTDNVPLTGTYESKVKNCLRKSKMHSVYGVFKTNVLRDSYVNESFVGNDLPILLNALKYGDLNVVDENLMSIYDAGVSKKGIIHLSRQFNRNFSGIIFPMYPLTKWCFNCLGKRIFFKNISYFVQLNAWGIFSIFVDVVRIILIRLTHK